MLAWLSRASIGIHTMVDEHFGINVVEFMVRSLFVMECKLIWIIGCGRDPCCSWLCWAFARYRCPIRWTNHRSYSLLTLLTNKPTSKCTFTPGYHATSPEEFAEAIHTVLTLPPVEELGIRDRARKLAVKKFSEEEFERAWNESGWKKWLWNSE